MEIVVTLYHLGNNDKKKVYTFRTDAGVLQILSLIGSLLNCRFKTGG
jgi:hypothetical protein